MKVIAHVLSWLILSVPLHGQGLPPISIWVPGEYASSPGNSLQTFPYREHTTEAPGRYQQVFSASEFAAIPDGGYITGFTLRRRGNGWFEGDSSSFQITMSTTQAQPDSLNPVFALNTGPDSTVVFGPSRLRFRTSTSIGDNRVVAFSTPFLYQPSRGNLLMDLQNFSGNDLFYDARTADAGDSVYAIGDSVSRVVGHGANAISGTASSTGYIVQFQVQPIPWLTNAVVGTDLVLTWGAGVVGFTLEMTGTLSPATVWTAYTGQVQSNGSWNTVTLPIANLGAERYFRLRNMQ